MFISSIWAVLTSRNVVGISLCAKRVDITILYWCGHVATVRYNNHLTITSTYVY